MFCQNCGHKKEGTERFCARCGASPEGAAIVRRPAFASLSKILGIAGGVFLVIVMAVLLLGRKSPHASPEIVVYSFLTAAFEESNASRVLEFIDPQALETHHDDGIGIDEIREDFQDYIDVVSRAIETERELSLDFVVERTELQNGSAEVVVSIIFRLPDYEEELLIYLTVIERDGLWYIYEFDDECIVDSFRYLI